MATQQQDRQETEEQGNRRRDALLGGQVLRALGQPGVPHAVQVRPLWDGHYRVNVFVGADITSLRVAHSYFLVTDGDGAILSATPPITRQYGCTQTF
jgi:hypothetical protein